MLRTCQSNFIVIYLRVCCCWFFEKLPHPLFLAIFACGCCTILGVILVISCCSATIVWRILRFLFFALIAKVPKGVLAFWLIVAQFALHVVYTCMRVSIRTVNRAQWAIRDRRSSNKQEAIAQQFLVDHQIADRPTETSTQAIDATAFWPRHRTC